MQATRFGREGGESIILRFSYFHAPDSDFTRDTIRQAKKGWAATFGSPDEFMASIHADDAATAVVAAIDAHAGTYNVSDDEPLRRRGYFDVLAGAIGCAPPRLPPEWLGRIAGAVGDAVARSQRVSNRRFREASGWGPQSACMWEGWVQVVAEAAESTEAAPSRV